MALVSMRQLPDHAAVYGYGVQVEEIQEGIEHGVRNINIDTDICLAMTGATVALSTKPKVNLIRVNIGSGRHSLQNPSARRASKHLVLPAMRTRSNSCRWKPWQIDMPRVSSSR